VRKFSLRRYYAFVSFVGVATVVVGLSWFTRNEAVQALIDHQSRANEDITNSFANSVWPQFIKFVAPSKISANTVDLKKADELQKLLAMTNAQMRKTNVVKVKIYNLEGLTVFSKDETQIGEDKSSSVITTPSSVAAQLGLA
jgi:hypothetical protein